MAKAENPDNKPHDMEKAISVAYLRSCGFTQEIVAKSVKVGVRTIYRWERCNWWPAVVVEAHRRWLTGIACKARGGILRALDDPKEYASTSKWVAERAFVGLEPPALQHEIAGKGGKPIEINTAKARVTGTVTSIAAAIEAEQDPAEPDGGASSGS